MRIVRRVALLGSVLLVIAAAVGVAVQRGAASRERDVAVQSAALVAASELHAAVVAAQATAVAAPDVDAARTALALLPERASSCVAPVDDGSPQCVGGADAAGLADAVAARRGEVEVVAGGLRLVAVGDDVVVGVHLEPDAAGSRADVSLRTSAEAPSAGLDTVEGLRRSTEPVDGTDASVVASLDASTPLAGDAWLFLVLVLVLAAALLAVAGATLRAEQRTLVERASIDPLTGLPNRGEFERRAETTLEEARRTGDGACMLLFDLDGFKLINDTEGHQAGDEVLRVIGRRLRRAVRDYDVVARWGGDEFVLLLPGIEDASAARKRAGELAELVSGDPIGDGLRVGASVGIAMFPRHGADLTALVEAADAAMYAAKRDGVTSRLAGIESAPLTASGQRLVERRHRHAPTR
jgi:diguanylate cyclase (GGDEF)-like protein